MNIRPFEIDVSQARLDDLQLRLAGTRWPTPLAGFGWDDGADFDFMTRVIAHWRDSFDWRAQEARLNGLPQYLQGLEAFSSRWNASNAPNRRLREVSQ